MDLVTPPLSQGQSIAEVAESRVDRLSCFQADHVDETRNGGAQTTPRRPKIRGLMLLLRRAHLYAGLLMLPWVFLYGITGILFNHPTWFSDQTILPFGTAEMRETALEGFPEASDIAQEVVAAINARAGGGYRLVEPGAARFERGGLTGSVLVGGQPYTVSLDPSHGGGTIRAGTTPRGGSQAALPPSRPRGGPDEGSSDGRQSPPREERRRDNGSRGGSASHDTAGDPFAALGRLEIADSPLERMRLGLPGVLARAGLPGASVSEVRAAPLSFLVEGREQRWRASYDLQSGAISGRSADEATAGSELSTRRFLLRLHTAHGYPSEFNARWVWAVIVDVMSAIMIFWGVSGVVMWWQIKRTRRLGSAALLVSAVAATWVFVEMHSLLLALGR